MKVQPAAFLRTTLPLDLSPLDDYDSGRYHSVWLPDHMVSFWPDSIWTEEFTDLATVSPSPHRHLDSLAVASAAAVLTKNVPLATAVVDTVRRHLIRPGNLRHPSGQQFPDCRFGAVRVETDQRKFRSVMGPIE